MSVLKAKYNGQWIEVGEKLFVANGTNAAQSDFSQNDSTKIDYIKNRTHYEEIHSITYAWDGNITNQDSFIFGDIVYYKVSNDIENVTLDTFLNAIITLSDNSILTVMPEDVMVRDDLIGIEPLLILRDTDIILGENIISAPSTGAYCAILDGVYIKSFFNQYSIVHKLDDKFIPDTVAKKTDLLNNTLINPPTAAIGQIMIVKEVDEYGAPIAWQAADINTLLGALLPPVTEADNGKVLAVVDGQWQAFKQPIAEEESF